MSPPRPSDSHPLPPGRGAGATPAPSYPVVRARVLFKLQDRLDPARSRRMPASLFAETARQQVEQVVEAEAARLTRAEREQLVQDVLEEAFGFGPLEELFADPGVKEITVLGPHAVIARRDHGWLPTNVKFRDEDHLHEVLDRLRGHGVPVGGGLPASVLDVRLANGFRAIGVVPPPVVGQPPTLAFVRSPEPVPEVHPGFPGGGSREAPAAASPDPVPSPPPRSGAARSPAPGEYPLERYRLRIIERLVAKLARLGVYDLSGIETGELRKVVAAYVEEYCRQEKVYLSPTDQGRLTLEILTAMNR
jgi:pilus assembly protein CpaF